MRKRAKKHAVVITTDAEIDAALRAAKDFMAEDRRATSAKYDCASDRIVIDLVDGVQFSIPRRYLQGLENAEPADIAEIELWGSGTGLHWPRLDVDHYVLGLLNHIFGTRKWMAHLGRLGGASTSKAKAAAARANGRKGGRPRKQRLRQSA